MTFRETLTIELTLKNRNRSVGNAFSLCRKANQFGLRGMIELREGIYMLLEGPEKRIYEFLFEMNIDAQPGSNANYELKFKNIPLPYRFVFLKRSARNLKGFAGFLLKLLFKPYKFKGIEETDLFLPRLALGK